MEIGADQPEPGMQKQANHLFEQDALLPAQWKSIYSESAAGPYQRLGLALIEDALLVFSRPWTSSVQQQGEEDGAMAWVTQAGSAAFPMCFNTACGMAFPDKDPGAMQEAVLRRMSELRRHRRRSWRRGGEACERG